MSAEAGVAKPDPASSSSRCGGYDVRRARRCSWATRPRRTSPARRRAGVRAVLVDRAAARPPMQEGVERIFTLENLDELLAPRPPPPSPVTDEPRQPVPRRTSAGARLPGPAAGSAGTGAVPPERRLTASQGLASGLLGRDRAGDVRCLAAIVAIIFARRRAPTSTTAASSVRRHDRPGRGADRRRRTSMTADLGRPTPRDLRAAAVPVVGVRMDLRSPSSPTACWRPSTRCSFNPPDRGAAEASSGRGSRACCWRSPPACSLIVDRAVRGGDLLPRLPVPGVPQQLRRLARRAR